MSVGFQDNFKVGAPKPIDSRYGYDDPTNGQYRLYANTAEAITSILPTFRHQGLTVAINNGNKAEEWWFRDNTTTLVKKTSGVSGVENGLSINSANDNIRLGGDLTQTTTIGTSSTNTLSITGLVESSSNVYSITLDANGRLYKSNYVSAITADNGITKTNNNIKLGGPLTAATSIDLATYTLTLKTEAGTFKTGIEIISGVDGSENENPTISSNNKNRIGVTGNLSVSGLSYFAGNIGMGATPFLLNNSGDVRLNVYKIGLPPNENVGKESVSASSNSVELTKVGTYTSAPVSYFGSLSRIYLSIKNIDQSITTGNQVFNNTSTYTGGLSYFQFATAKNISGGTCSAHAAQAQFQKATAGGLSGNLDKVIVYRAMAPVADVIIGYAGTVGETVGLQIEDQSITIGTNPATIAYGIKQLGNNSRNYFESNRNIFLYLPTSATGLPSGCLWRDSANGNVVKVVP